MSTSPSWFDQEKFSRLVKKARPKTAPEPVAPAPGPIALAPTVSPVAAASPAELAGPANATIPVDVASHADAATPTEVISSTDAASAPGLQPVHPAPASVVNMMTSQSVSLKGIVAPPSVIPVESAPQPEMVVEDFQHPPTTQISLVSKSPAGGSEPRALPSLPRRTAPLPALKAIFQYEVSASRSPKSPPTEVPGSSSPPPLQSREEPIRAPLTGEMRDGEPALALSPKTIDPVVAPWSARSEDDLTAAWEKIAQLNEEVNRANRARDLALGDKDLLLEQLKRAEETSKGPDDTAHPSEDHTRLIQERDDAQAEANSLREQLRQAHETVSARDSETETSRATQAEQISQLTQERDQSRRDYVGLREEFEHWKLEQSRVKGEESAADNEQEKALIDGLRQQLEAKSQEINSLKLSSTGLEDVVETLKQELSEVQARAALAASEHQQLEAKEQEITSLKLNSTGLGDVVETLKQELSKLQEEITQSRSEASVAQRGLALSQKALQDTREALRESEAANTLTRSNLDNLKKECSTMVQQNMLLQAQNDQLARDLSATKAKLARA